MARDRRRVASPIAAPVSWVAGPVASGQTLDAAVAGVMGSRLGQDFSRVRVHTDDAAAHAAESVGAAAFTRDEDIVFGHGRYAPGTPEGDRLLAHELTHVAQQRRGGDETAVEERADNASARVAAGERVPAEVVGGAGLGIHRQKDGTKKPYFEVSKLALTIERFGNFDHNQAALKPEHAARVKFLVDLYFAVAVKSPGSKIVLTGHTDLSGGEQLNVELGYKRAVAAAAALIEAGVPGAMIRVESAGESKPVVDTPSREPANRRVDAAIESPATTGASPPPVPPKLLPLAVIDPIGPGKGTAVPHTWTTPKPTLLPGSSWTPKAVEGPPREGKAGDLVKAITQVPEVKKLIADATKEPFKTWSGLPKADKVVVGSTAVTMGVLAGVGVTSDPAARKQALGLLDGQEIEVANGVKIQIKTKDPGGVIKVDVLKIFGGGK